MVRSAPPLKTMTTTMNGRRRRMIATLLVASWAVVPLMSAQTPKNPQAAPKKNPLLKLAEPWPSADVLHQRHAEAEALPLFASDAPLAITLTADFKTVMKDRTPNSTQRFP